MPELPEVHRLVSYLDRGLAKQSPVIKRMGYNVKNFFKEPEEQVLEFFTGNTFKGVYRKGKYILIETARGLVVVHLRFSGWFNILGEHAPLRYLEFRKLPGIKTVHLVWEFESDHKWLFNDARCLSVFRIYPGELNPRNIKELARQGPDFVVLPSLHPAFSSWTLDRKIWERALDSGKEIKMLLLEQTAFAGIGNIYACEALWHASISPFRRANMLTPLEQVTLWNAVNLVLNLAVHYDCEYDQYIKVFRAPNCGRCGHEITRGVQSKRGSYYCEACQK